MYILNFAINCIDFISLNTNFYFLFPSLYVRPQSEKPPFPTIKDVHKFWGMTDDIDSSLYIQLSSQRYVSLRVAKLNMTGVWVPKYI